MSRFTVREVRGIMTPTCETCAHGDKDSDAEPCNRCAVTDGPGSRYPIQWEPKPAPAMQTPQHQEQKQ